MKMNSQLTNKGEPILEIGKAKEPRRKHEDKSQTTSEKDHSGRTHHLRLDEYFFLQTQDIHHIVNEYPSPKKRSFMGCP